MIHASVHQHRPRPGAGRRRPGAPLWVLLLGIALIALTVAPLRTTPVRTSDAAPAPIGPTPAATDTARSTAPGG